MYQQVLDKENVLKDNDADEVISDLIIVTSDISLANFKKKLTFMIYTKQLKRRKAIENNVLAFLSLSKPKII